MGTQSNKLSLFDIGTEFRVLHELSNSEEFDSETGELLDNSKHLTELFNEIEATLGNKLDATMYIIKQLESEQQLLKDEAKRLTDRAKTRANKVEFLKSLMFSALNATNETKLKTTKFNYTIKRSESISVSDVDLLPREYVRLKREADKKAVKDALKSGATIEGCSIDEKFSLGVR